MRERLVLAFVGLTLAIIALYGVPRAYFLADLVHDDAVEQLDAGATTMAALVSERERSVDPVDGQLLEHGLASADRVEYTAPDGEVWAVGPAVPVSGSIVETRRLAGGSRLTMRTAASTLSERTEQAIIPLVLLGTLLAMAAAALGLWLARRMSRPFTELARVARQLGDGQFQIDLPSYSVPEAREICVSLKSTGERLEQLVRREREFAVNASHQLRTPITALRLSLEDLALWPDTTPEMREELERSVAELDRLNGAITELLDLARGRRLGERSEIDLSALVAAVADRWQTRIEEEGRAVVTRAPGLIHAQVPAGPVEQVLDVLIENARLHGRGTITLTTRDAGSHLEVVVADEGSRSLGGDIFRRGVTTRSAPGDAHGIGLAVASELAEVAGGHLSLDTSAPTTTFVLWLPVATLGL